MEQVNAMPDDDEGLEVTLVLVENIDDEMGNVILYIVQDEMLLHMVVDEGEVDIINDDVDANE